jgi:DNA recombination protein RmuC
MEWLILLAGLVVGGLAAWFLGKAQAKDSLDIVKQQIAQKDEEIIKLRELYDTERVTHAGLKSRMDEAEKNLAAQKTFLSESQKTLSDAFGTLSKDALNSNNEMFLQLAKSNLERLVSDAKGDLSKRQEAIDNLLKPLNEALKEYRQQVQNLEVSRKEAYGSLDQQLKGVASTTQSLQKETGNLVQALRAPQVRGRWGEMTLRRVAELAGMSDRCDFEEQASVESESGRLRPDMTVFLPGGRNIVVDSKVPLVAFLDMLSATTEEERAHHLKRHAGQVREHMRKLAAKEYWNQFEKTPDFVVMFIPAESFFSAAVEVDRSLIEDGLRNNVILSSPTTFIALLRTVAMGWRQEQMAENATRISALGAQVHERITKFVEHFARVGRALEKATESYNASVGTLESRVLTSARKFKELGATAQADIPEISQIDRVPRSIDAEPVSPEEEKAL